MSEVGTVGKISDCQPGGPRFNHQPGRGLNSEQPSFVTNKSQIWLSQHIDRYVYIQQELVFFTTYQINDLLEVNTDGAAVDI